MTPEEAYEILAECPFCKGANDPRPVVMGEWDDVGIDWGIECDCGCTLQSFEEVWTLETAVSRWNTPLTQDGKEV